MSTRTAPLPSAAGPADRAGAIQLGIGVLAAVDLVVAVFMAVAPIAFFKAIGPFGAFNAHYARDVATFEAALGIGLALALSRPTWRVPMLALSAVQYALHSANHLLDIDTAHPAWAGYLDFVSLLAATLLLVWLTRLAAAEQPSTDPNIRKGGSP